MTKILNVNSSVRITDSASRTAGALLIEALKSKHDVTSITQREVTTDAAFMTEEWVGASFTPADVRTAAQTDQLATSDKLAQEVLDADIVVITASMYNFGIPAPLKAWIDQIARPGLTFRPDPELTYVGLATGKTAYLCVATGETPVGSDMDYVSPYLRQVLGFLGIADVHVIAGDMSVVEADTLDDRLKAQVASALG